MEATAIIVVLIVALLFLLSSLVGTIQDRRRAQEFLAALGDSTRGKVSVQQNTTWGGFLATITPAPDPFIHFQAQFTAVSYFSPIDQLLRSGSGRGNRFVLQARLSSRPRQELLWLRDRTPSQALGRIGDPSLWTLRQLDWMQGEFAVRGVNTGGIEHAFFDLQARFGAFLLKVSIQASTENEVEIVLATGRLNPQEMPAFVTTVRALGRASLVA